MQNAAIEKTQAWRFRSTFEKLEQACRNQRNKNWLLLGYPGEKTGIL